MLTPDQRRQFEMQEAERMRQAWGGPVAYTIRNILDDIRAKVVEEPWFGKPVTEQLNDVRRFYGTHTSTRTERMRMEEERGREAEREQDAEHGL
ncbi:MAG: hypothetical protein NW215_00670 [Hyphomicrobiales bacterium]|nr:hypothetical protein [Hyphomicrobiales bacterium]